MKYILYNPLAGQGNAKEQSASLAERYGNDIIVKDITTVADYADLLAPLSEQDSVVVCGGDGTLNRFINAIEGIDVKCDVLYYAAGSGNDFLRDIEADCNDGPVLINKYIKDLPVAEVKGKKYRFLNNLGFGIDGYCCEVGDKQKAASAKTVNYTAIAIKGLLFHYKPTNATVVVDGKQYNFKKVWIAPTMKGRFYGGGMMAAPAQDRLDPDGTLSVMVFGGGGRLRTLMAFPSIFKGEHVKYTKMVHIISGKDISVTFDSPAPVQIDGETILGVTSYHAYACVNAEIKA